MHAVFLMPKKIIQLVTNACMIFLWTFSQNPSKRALIAWDRICMPTSAGRLNVINFLWWNKAALCRGQFNIKKTYTLVSPQYPKVHWKALMMGSNAIPRHNFILWLTLHQRLTTVDRLVTWGIQVASECVLYNSGKIETMAHLFFECQYSRTIWSTMLKWMGERHPVGFWEEEVVWLKKRTKNGRPRNSILAFLFAAVVYHTWIERNMRRFQGQKTDTKKRIRDVVLQLHIKGQQKAKWKKILEGVNSFPL
ncbi:uncharacterized protein LOC107825152 [Nicotiana tabacum]|uniref:uncharacterized protein LOC107825152 n=1 Tax=Nicotiana tabacum TaxID=4097 RepID=UPI003F4E4CA0